MLRAENIRAGYGPIEIVRGVHVEVREGEVVSMVGRNGAGKTTFVNSIMGFNRLTAGRVELRGEDLTRARPDVRNRLGLAVVPQGRRVFGSLTVDQTLALAHRPHGWDLDRISAAFPRLAQRRKTLARSLSGGEQSALSMARALATGPSMILLDEPSEGMSPHVLRSLRTVIDELRQDGVGVLLVEQNLGFALAVADRVLVMSRGHIELAVEGDEARADPEALSRRLVLSRSG